MPVLLKCYLNGAKVPHVGANQNRDPVLWKHLHPAQAGLLGRARHGGADQELKTPGTPSWGTAMALIIQKVTQDAC
jgi:hypothetical protein